MTSLLDEFWADDTSVLFTSLWGWSPESWGTIGWTGERGFTRRANLLKELSDPFITVCYVTSNKSYADPAIKGMLAGFYLVTHQTGDRDEFTHPHHHDRDPDKWRHSLRAIRAFSYLPEYRMPARELEPGLTTHARHISSMGKILTNRDQIELLKSIPCEEVAVYAPPADRGQVDPSLNDDGTGMVKAGPAASGGYFVDSHAADLPRELYMLRMHGDIDAYLGSPADGCLLIKIGLSASPELRRQHFQKVMPRGKYSWVLHRTTTKHASGGRLPFPAAVAGEDAMKKYLAANAKWLGGEFYLASAPDIDQAWDLAHEAAASFDAEEHDDQ